MSTKEPISYGVLLFPGFEVLDIAGPLECLNMLTKRPNGSHLTLSVIGASIDNDNPNIPADVTPAHSSFANQSFQQQQVYKPTHTFDNAPPLDVLLVPGGRGTRPISERTAEVAFLKSVYPSLTYLFTICTGVSLAVEAGLLQGHKATGNKAVWKAITAAGPGVHWIAHARWVVSGSIWTSSGVSAGTDAMLAFLEHIYSTSLVQDLCNAMEYIRTKDASEDPFSKIYGAEDVLPVN